MSTAVGKFVECDRCGATERCTVADRLPYGWHGTHRWGGGHLWELCHDCGVELEAWVALGPGSVVRAALATGDSGAAPNTSGVGGLSDTGAGEA